MRHAREDNQGLSDELAALLASSPSDSAPLRDAGAGLIPVDQDTRLQLLRYESPVIVDHPPILAHEIKSVIDLVIAERSSMVELAKSDLKPTTTLLFTGPPGVGKTLSARWLAYCLGKPLLTLDLATVISSFLGRTGTNLRYVLDYAKNVDSVFLLDEFDAIAKRRGDETELGELKRLVTVLLQEIDLWPSDRMLVAATNHGELLDRAVWRRFDIVLEFPLPNQSDIKKIIKQHFGEKIDELGPWHEFLVEFYRNRSFSDVERLANQIRRRALVSHMSLEQAAVETIPTLGEHRLPLAERKRLAIKLRGLGLSERKVREITGVARDTVRKALKTGLDNTTIDEQAGKQDNGA